MNVISLKDYAKQNNISYEAVRQQVVRYTTELGEHIIKDGRQHFLDEEAVAFLDSKRQKNPVVLIQQDKDEQINELEHQVKELLVKTAAQADRISELSEWKAENAVAIAEANQRQLRLEVSEKEVKLLEGFLQDAKTEISVLTDEKNEAIRKASEELSAARKREEEKDKRIQELENRTFGDYLKGLFRKKDKECELNGNCKQT